MACSVPFVKLSIIYIFVFANSRLFVDFINSQISARIVCRLQILPGALRSSLIPLAQEQGCWIMREQVALQVPGQNSQSGANPLCFRHLCRSKATSLESTHQNVPAL